MEDAGGQWLADHAVGHQASDRAMRGRIPQVMIGAEHHARGATGVDHCRGVFNRQRQWLFAQDVLASACRGKRLRAMQVVGSADVDAIHARIGQHRVKVVVRARDTQLRREGLRPRHLAAHHGHDLAVRLLGDGRRHARTRDVAGSNQPPAD